MADTPLAPAARPANISRRQILSGSAAASFTALAAPLHPASTGRRAWQAMLDRYHAAERRYDSFYRTRWRLAHDAMYAEGGRDAPPQVRGELMEKYGIGALEELGGELCGEQFCRMQALVFTPAPDLRAFRTKMEISYRDFFADEGQHGELAAALLADVQRLISV